MSKSPGALFGQVAIITGGSRGIGREIAYRLAVDGAQVVIGWAHESSDAERTIAEISQAGGRTVAIQTDQGDASAVRDLFATTIHLFGGVDIVIAHAGMGGMAPLADYDDEEFDNIVRVNIRGTYAMLKEAAKHLRDRGRVITTSSGWAHQMTPNTAPYAATKAAIEVMTKVAALELAPRGITANSVAPSYIATESWTQQHIQSLQPTLDTIPLGGPGSPSDVAGAVRFLVSEDAKWITGQVINVSGGL